MKKLTCLFIVIFCLGIHLQIIAQAKKPASKASIPKMPDIQKMLNDLPPDQRAMANQMLKNVPNASVNVKAAPTKSSPSVITQIPLNQPLVVPTEAQANDHLLWYKGKKINDSMLVTTKAMVVLYRKKQHSVVLQPSAKSDPFGKLVNNLKKADQMTDDYIEEEAAKKNSFMNYPLVQITVDELIDKDNQLKEAVNNTIVLPETPVPAADKTVDNTSVNSTNLTETVERNLKELHNQLKQLLQNEPPIHVEPPPKKKFSLESFCDENELKRYQEERKKWEEESTDYDHKLMSAYLGIQRSIALTGVDTANNEKLGSGNLTADLEKAFKRYISRSDEKAKQLINGYGKDIFMQDCVIQTVLANERTQQLLGIETKTDQLKNITELLEGPEYENYINEQIDKKNWDVILNLSIMLGRARQLQLLGASDAAVESLEKLVARIIKLNRFALTANLDFSIQFVDKDGRLSYKATGEIETPDKVFVCLARTGCKWTLQQTGVEYGKNQEAMYINMKVAGGIKTMRNERDRLEEFPYSGQKELMMMFPEIRIDFADQNVQDTATIGLVRYPPGANIEAPVQKNAYTTELLATMQTVYFALSKMEPAMDKIPDFVNQMKNKFSALVTMPNSTTTLGKLKDKFLMMQQTQQGLKTVAEIGFTARPVILFKAQNGSSILIDDSVDTKHKEEDFEVTKGIIKLKVVHDPIQD